MIPLDSKSISIVTVSILREFLTEKVPVMKW